MKSIKYFFYYNNITIKNIKLYLKNKHKTNSSEYINVYCGEIRFNDYDELSLFNIFNFKYIDYAKLSGHPKLSIQILEKYNNKPWDFNILSKNNCITIDYIEKYIDKPWNWNYLSYNTNITSEFIEKYIDKPWNWSVLSENILISSEFIKKYIDKPWNWNILLEHHNTNIILLSKYFKNKLNNLTTNTQQLLLTYSDDNITFNESNLEHLLPNFLLNKYFEIDKPYVNCYIEYDLGDDYEIY